MIGGVNDSKKLTEKKREELFDVIRQTALAYSVAWASVEEIECMNILQATMLAMKRAIQGLSVTPDFVMVDGNKCPDVAIPHTAIVKGDALSESIAAASVLAKVSRDRLMLQQAEQYPEYRFEKHKGYGTKLHREMLQKYGPCAIHRMSFLTKILGEKMTEDRRTSQRIFGDNGEALAEEKLKQEGYSIIARNYRTAEGEIDLIAENEGYIVFAEVKTRDISTKEPPSAAVDDRKRQKLLKTAEQYMKEYHQSLPVRMDIIEIVCDRSKNEVSYIRHLKGAFE